MNRSFLHRPSKLPLIFIRVSTLVKMTRYLRFPMSWNVIDEESDSDTTRTHTKISLGRVFTGDANRGYSFLGEASDIDGAKEVQRGAYNLYAVPYGQQRDPEGQCLP
jgi:hypothetical protein